METFNNYEQFGKEWKDNIYKNANKRKLIDMYRKVCIRLVEADKKIKNYEKNNNIQK